MNKCESLEGVDVSELDCVYSPAKRRGPVPGRSAHSRANQAVNDNTASGMVIPVGYLNATPSPPVQAMMSHQQVITQNSLNEGMVSSGIEGVPSNNQLKNMLALQQQFQMEQLQHQGQGQGTLQQLAPSNNALLIDNTAGTGISSMMGGNNFMGGGNGNIAANMPAQTDVSGRDTNSLGFISNSGNAVVNTNRGPLDNTTNYQNFPAQHQQLNQQQQQLSQQFFQQEQQRQQALPSVVTMPNQRMPMNQTIQNDDDRLAKRAHMVADTAKSSALPNLVAKHLPLLHPTNPDGKIVRSYYELSTNDVLNLPPIPSDEEYCARLNNSLQLQSLSHNNNNNFVLTPTNLPTYDQSALHAARFSELALGALANNQVPLALELSNASVMCLRNCVEEPSHNSCMYDVARAYLLHGIFRSFRGDMVRYFKYRRVCLTHILQMNTEPQIEALLAAISFHDAWAYMMHNASEDTLPNIDGLLPRLNSGEGCNATINASTEEESIIKAKYGCSTNASSVVTDPINQMWMQGSPPVFLNNEACPVSRSLDAFACAVRSCCDQAKLQFEDMAKVSGQCQSGSGELGQLSPTTTAVLANENELCSRNIVLSAKTLLDQHSPKEKCKKYGLRMVATAMDAFLENGQNDEQLGSSPEGGNSGGSGVGGFTDRQIKNLLEACDIIIQHPLLLHSPGPVYHMSSNAAILLCHLLNGIYSNCNAANRNKYGNTSTVGNPSKVEGILFDEVLDTFMTMRKILNIHRKSLPVKLRCHGLPRPNIGPFKKLGPEPDKQPFIELGDTLMCLCRGCQGFVLMGCSPCVAAEQMQKRTACEQKNSACDEELLDFGDINDIHFDDDALLDVLSQMIQN